MSDHHYLIASVLLALAAVSCSEKTPVEYADPFVGTGFHGHTYPGATSPFGMVQLSPDTRHTGWDGCSGYHYSDSTIRGFSHTHLSGTGCADLGDFLFTPAVGEVAVCDSGYAVAPLPFSHTDETASPGYYRVRFPARGITAELTATAHVGFHRYTFTGEGERHLLIDLHHTIGEETVPRDIRFEAVGDTCVRGGRVTDGWTRNRPIHFTAHFSIPFTDCSTRGGDRWLLTFPEGVGQLEVSVALSGVDADGAEHNWRFEAGGRSFDEIRSYSRWEWAGELGRIKVQGGTPEQRAVFYSALYHTMLTPNLLTDLNGRYRNHRGETAQAPPVHDYYSTLSLWDTFRAWNPLQMLLHPKLVDDMAYSLLDMYECDGRLPLWPLGAADTHCMIGYHAVPVLADAWLHGIRGFDGEQALAAMVATSNSDPASALYNAYGYIPADQAAQSVSKTLEFAYDDWCIARMAESLGHADLAAEYDARALRYRNLFDGHTGFFRGRESDGNWREPFNPLASSRDFTEAIPWQYRFFVPHDFDGLTGLMGGRPATKAALDSLFTYEGRDADTDISDMTGLVGEYAHGNEPSHATAWMYEWLGAPSSTERRVRQMLTEMYAPTPEGISGNEDCGQMSAWYVLSALGLYPACPGTGEFLLAAPLFKKADIILGNGNRLVIKADHPEYAYVSSVRLNGQPLGRLFVRYEELMAGGELSFTLSATPSDGREGLERPYSLTDGNVTSVPYLPGDPRFFEGSYPVRLACRTEGAVLRYTLDGSEPVETSPLYEGVFDIDRSCILSVRAFKEGMAPGPALRAEVFPQILRPARPVTGLRPGCRYSYHTGAFTCTADVTASAVKDRGLLPAPAIDNAPDEDHFGYVFSGFLDVPEEGLWTFALSSDDGAVLYVDGERVVDNDGSHSAYTSTGRIPLCKGFHPFRLIYLEDYEGQVLAWGWKAPGADRFTPIPENVIYH